MLPEKVMKLITFSIELDFLLLQPFWWFIHFWTSPQIRCAIIHGPSSPAPADPAIWNSVLPKYPCYLVTCFSSPTLRSRRQIYEGNKLVKKHIQIIMLIEEGQKSSLSRHLLHFHLVEGLFIQLRRINYRDFNPLGEECREIFKGKYGAMVLKSDYIGRYLLCLCLGWPHDSDRLG